MPPSEAEDIPEEDITKTVFFRNFCVFVTVLLFCGAVGMTIVFIIEQKWNNNLLMAMRDIRSSMIMSNTASKTMSDPQILNEARRLAIHLYRGNKKFKEVFKEIRDIEKKKKSGWIAFNGNLYYFSPLMNVYYVAEKECEMNNSKLVYINSPEEEKFLERLVAAKRAPHWLGLFRQGNAWVWSNDGPVLPTAKFWKDRRPGPLSDLYKICAQIVPCGTATLKCWEDIICESYNNWICKMKPESTYLP
ncbi:C-type lectin domain family 4 member K-like isoform X2 [Paroedura picta]|uniref:C-type lectin domain family 4 member K-like isoform X2 n=1 Tax=Paroedura picta TaxID=143630 RepID=UPI004057651F